MKRFIISIAVVTTFFLGLGSLAEKTGARYKSDEKALELIRKSRVAIGGDNALAAIQSMRITGNTTSNVKVNGVDESRTSETEINMMLPDRLMKSIKMGDGGDGSNPASITKQFDVVVVNGAPTATTVRVDADGTAAAPAGQTGVKRIVIKQGDGPERVITGAEADKIVAEDAMGGGGNVKHIILKKDDGTVQELTGAEADKFVVRPDGNGNATFTTKEGQNIVLARTTADGVENHPRHNEMLRLTLGLLLTAPQGMDVEYAFGGAGDLDGTACNIVIASFGGQSYKLYLDSSSNLPVGMTYTGVKMPKMVMFKRTADAPADAEKQNVVVRRTVEGHALETTEFTVKFSDFRTVNGIQLPYEWTQTAGGVVDEVFDITNYEINPANMADKFKDQKVVMLREKAPEAQ